VTDDFYFAKLLPDYFDEDDYIDIGGLTSGETIVDSVTADSIVSMSAVFESLTTGTIVIGGLYVEGSYLNPLRIATKKLWHDTINDVFRVKSGTDPISETDGNILNEGLL